MISLDTLQALKDRGYRLTAYCEIDTSCRHDAELDLDALIERLGPDFPIGGSELARRLVCAACGRKGVSIRMGAPNGYSVRRK